MAGEGSADSSLHYTVGIIKQKEKRACPWAAFDAGSVRTQARLHRACAAKARLTNTFVLKKHSGAEIKREEAGIQI